MLVRYAKQRALLQRFNDIFPKVNKYTEDLKLNLDLFGQTKYDARALGVIIGEFKCWKRVERHSGECGTKESEVKRYYLNTQRVKEVRKVGDSAEGIVEEASTNIAFRKLSNCALLNEPIFAGLKKALGTGALQTLHLVNIKTSRLGWAQLGQGL